MSSKRPVEVRLDRDNGRVVIRWDDGARLEYLLDALRNACPCAACRGHSPGEVEPPRKQGMVLRGIHEVGTYALRFDWSDGHSTGIYTWPYLLEVGRPMIA
jgi:DUF971 family protein